MTTKRGRIFLACLAAALSLALVAESASAAAPRAKSSAATTRTQERKQNSAIKRSARNIRRVRTTLKAFGTALNTTKGDVNILKTLAAGLPPVLTQLGDGLTALKTALEDPTTGLVGLNNARPQFGAFDVDGVFIDGTGAHPPAKGPSGDATQGGAAPDIDGLFVVDFGNDVSERVYSVNVFPYVPVSIGGGGTTPVGSAFNCASSTTTAGVCGAVAGVASDSSPNHVLVQIGNGSSGGAANGFSLTALSG